jgi:hypothetical protein
MLEWLAPSFAYTLGKDLLAYIRGKRRFLSPKEIIELRQKWKPQFEAEILKNHKEKLRSDVIIRDLKRIDSYPELEETKGISPWFRAGLVGTYHRGILVGLRWGDLTTHHGDKWRYTNYQAGEKGDLKVLLIGSIRYEDIDGVDWDGDEYYYYPHIYCYFGRQKEPYEHKGFYTEIESSERPPHYREVATYDEVRKLSLTLGVPHFG